MTATISPPRQTTYSPSSVSNQLVLIISIRRATVQISYKTIATFCEHTAEMLEGVSDNAELIKRHRASGAATRRPCSIALDYRIHGQRAVS
jgi:hypothetical protein